MRLAHDRKSAGHEAVRPADPQVCPPVVLASCPPAPIPQPGRYAIFIVDDSPLVRDRLVTLLSELPNVEVVGQADIAFEAIDSIRKLRPSVVVLDISMPGGSGMHVLETIKRERPEAVVIMLTNFAHDHYRQRCLQLGADYFFDKSIEFERVIEVLRQLPPLAAAQEPLMPAA